MKTIKFLICALAFSWMFAACGRYEPTLPGKDPIEIRLTGSPLVGEVNGKTWAAASGFVIEKSSYERVVRVVSEKYEDPCDIELDSSETSPYLSMDLDDVVFNEVNLGFQTDYFTFINPLTSAVDPVDNTTFAFGSIKFLKVNDEKVKMIVDARDEKGSYLRGSIELKYCD